MTVIYRLFVVLTTLLTVCIHTENCVMTFKHLRHNLPPPLLVIREGGPQQMLPHEMI